MSPSTRPPAVAGTFYPADPGALRSAIRAAFAESLAPPPDSGVPQALVVPHAGYVYSGPIAATAFRRLEPARSDIRRVLLLGPNHYVPVSGVALSSADVWETPLGEVRLDTDAISRLGSLPWATVNDAAHAPEHSLEVQVPFLQSVLDDFSLIPVLVGEARPDRVAEIIDRFWDDPETIIIVSTDLSHYHRYAEAVELDRRTAVAVTELRGGEIEPEWACGARALRGLLHAARGRGFGVRELDLRNSGDTAGDRTRVVGYGAFAVA